jgi:hypothetical protein
MDHRAVLLAQEREPNNPLVRHKVASIAVTLSLLEDTYPALRLLQQPHAPRMSRPEPWQGLSGPPAAAASMVAKSRPCPLRRLGGGKNAGRNALLSNLAVSEDA